MFAIGGKADIQQGDPYVRFTPESGHFVPQTFSQSMKATFDSDLRIAN
jgi:hypothetical protein